MLLQTQEINSRILAGEAVRYSGVWDCFVRVTQEQGVLSFCECLKCMLSCFGLMCVVPTEIQSAKVAPPMIA